MRASGVVLQLRLHHRDAHPRQGLDALCREERAGDDNVRRLGDDRLRVARDLGLVLHERGDIGEGLVLGGVPHRDKTTARCKSQNDLIVSDGSRDDALRLGRDAHNAVQPLYLARPAEIAGVDDSRNVVGQPDGGFGGRRGLGGRGRHRLRSCCRHGRWSCKWHRGWRRGCLRAGREGQYEQDGQRSDETREVSDRQDDSFRSSGSHNE